MGRDNFFERGSSRKGFSIVEIIISIGVVAALIFVMGRFSNTISVLDKIINQKLQVGSDIVSSLQNFVTDVRSMSPSGAGGFAIESAASSSFVFYSDWDRDGTTERLRYFFVSSTLSKGIIEPTGNPPVYASSTEKVIIAIPDVVVGSSSFQYFDSASTGSIPLSSPIDPTAVHMMKIFITADISSSTSPKPESFSEIITVRNLRPN